MDLSSCYPEDEDGIFAMPTFKLPYLKTLSLVGTDAVLHLMCLPGLQELKAEDIALSYLTPLLRRSSCVLRKLNIDVNDESDDELISFLELIPTLTDLILCGFSTRGEELFRRLTASPASSMPLLIPHLKVLYLAYYCSAGPDLLLGAISSRWRFNEDDVPFRRRLKEVRIKSDGSWNMTSHDSVEELIAEGLDLRVE